MNNERGIDADNPNGRRLSLGATIRIALSGLNRLRSDISSADEATVAQLPPTDEQISRSHHPAFRVDADLPRMSREEMIAKLVAEGKIPPELHSVDAVDDKD